MRTLSSLLCQPAPDTAETTKLRAMRTQACIPQFLHTDETSENLSNALHTLFVHCLRLSAGPTATRGVRGLTYEAPARGRQFKLPRRTTPRPRQEAPTTAPLARPIASGSAPATPTSPFYPRARPREQWEGEKWPQILPAQPPSRDREARAGARVSNRY